VHAQTARINDMINILHKNVDELDTWAVKNGFKSTLDENSNDKNCKYFLSYELKNNSTEDIAFYKCIYDDYHPNIALRTRSEQDYLKFKDEAIILGFKYQETIIREKCKMLIYYLQKNGIKYELTISTTNYPGFNLYEIALKSLSSY
jgi:hypothetical protein